MTDDIKIMKQKIELIISKNENFINSIAIYNKNSQLFFQIDKNEESSLNYNMLNYIYKLLLENIEKIKNKELDNINLELENKILVLKKIDSNYDIIINFNLEIKNQLFYDKIMNDLNILNN